MLAEFISTNSDFILQRPSQKDLYNLNVMDKREVTFLETIKEEDEDELVDKSDQQTQKKDQPSGSASPKRAPPRSPGRSAKADCIVEMEEGRVVPKKTKSWLRKLLGF
jgi:hypothetical protein